MNKLAHFIENMSLKELKEFKEKVEKGELRKNIDKKLEIFKNSNKVCPVCNSPVGEEGLTLIFGSPDFKQKASFDAADCLEYFLYKLKK